MTKTVELHGNKIQWVALLAALMAGLQQMLSAGILTEEHAVWVLMATNILSAVLPALRGPKPKIQNLE